MSDGREKRMVEFIESYWTGGEYGSDYQWNDNHGELIRCKDCKYASEHCSYSVFGKPLFVCEHVRQIGREGLEIHTGEWYCADGERKTDND